MNRCFIIPGKPQGKARPKFGNGRAYTPQKTREYEEYIRRCYMAKYGNSPPLTGGVGISIEAAFSIPKSRSKAEKAEMISGKKRPTSKPDLDNIVKVVQDALNGIAFKDDAQIVIQEASKRYTQEEPWISVFLWKLEEKTDV